MIFLSDYLGPWLGHPDATNDMVANAEFLLEKVNRLLHAYGKELPINPNTKTNISGQTFGGFRPQSCPQGSLGSSHKEGRGVDIYDPENDLDDWITDGILTAYHLYREAPDSTFHWCHLTDRAPKSGNRTFRP